MLGWTTIFEAQQEFKIGNDVIGIVGHYFWDVFAELWGKQGMLKEVGRLHKQYPGYEIWVINNE
jgi:hypothetical protein